jgi:hypothetical protein
LFRAIKIPPKNIFFLRKTLSIIAIEIQVFAQTSCMEAFRKAAGPIFLLFCEEILPQKIFFGYEALKHPSLLSQS